MKMIINNKRIKFPMLKILINNGIYLDNLKSDHLPELIQLLYNDKKLIKEIKFKKVN